MGTDQAPRKGGERGPVFVEALGFGASDGPGRATRTYQAKLKSAISKLTADNVEVSVMPLTMKREPAIAAPGKHTIDPDPRYFEPVARAVRKILLNDDGTVKTGKDDVHIIATGIQDSSLLLNSRFCKANQIYDHGDIFRSAFKAAVETVDVVRLLTCIEQVRVLDLHSGGPDGCSPPWYCEFYNAQGYDAPPPECIDVAREEPDIIEVADDSSGDGDENVTGLQREIDSLTTLLAEAENDKKSVKRAAEEMRNAHALKIDELEEERVNLLDELDELHDQLESVRKDGAAKIASLGDRVDSVTEERDAALASSEAKDGIIEELTTRVASLESEAAQLRASADAAAAAAPPDNEEGGEEEVADPDAGAALAAVQLGDQSEQDEQQHNEGVGDGQEVDADADAIVVAASGTNRRWMRSQGVIDLTE